MHLSSASLALLSLAHQVAQVSGRIHVRAFGSLQDSYVESKIQLRSDVALTHAALHKRQTGLDGSAVSSSVASATPTPVVQTGSAPADEATQQACTQALSTLNGVASNPSGMAVCYNIPYLDSTSGEFQASFLLYQIAPATGGWATVPTKNMSMALAYPGAVVAAGGNATMTRRDRIEARQIIDAHGQLIRRADPPQLKSDLSFVGQVNPAMVGTNSTSSMQSALIPQVTLSGTNADGVEMSTPLSNKEASFVTGVFSNHQALIAQEAAAQAAVPFVLPGTTLGIFPIGLIITGAWTAIFIIALGLGTLGRYQFRESYRRRSNSRSASVGARGGAAYDKPR